MLIGNRNSFALELTPVAPSWDLRYQPEAAAWAGLSVWVAGKNLCAHIREGEETVRAAFFVPLGPLSDWFVRSYPGMAFEERLPWSSGSHGLHEDVRRWGEMSRPACLEEDAWLDLREGFWSRHFLVAGAEGSWLPNLAVLRQDDEVVLAWAPAPFTSRPSVMLLNQKGSALAKWADFDTVIGNFVDEVAREFERKHLTPYAWIAGPAPRLHDALPDAPAERIALFCAHQVGAVAEFLGVPEAEVVNVLGPEVARDPSTSPLCQILRDLPPTPSPRLGNEVRATVEDSKRVAARAASVAWAAGRTLARDAASSGSTAEEAGQLAARALRDRLQIDGQPIASTIEVLEHFGVGTRAADLTAQDELMIVAVARGGTPVVTVFDTTRTRTSWARRFEEARALGHALLDPLRGDALGAASTKWAQETRRRRSGAFAAELLLPASACVEASQGHLDGVSTEKTFEALLDRYQVGARTAAFQLYNHRLLSKAVRDNLIDEYAKKV